MPINLINIGYGNLVSASRIIAIVAPESAPSKRLISYARHNSLLIDATCGRRTRAIIVTDSNHIILSALLPETISTRFDYTKRNPGEQLDEQGD